MADGKWLELQGVLKLAQELELEPLLVEAEPSWE